MRFFFIIPFFFISCLPFNNEKTKKIYICGDHECVTKREIKNYFDNNISVEVYTVTSSKKKGKNFDLVQLNMSDKEKKEYISLTKKEEDIKKKLKKRKKVAKINVKEGEGSQKVQKKLKINKRKEKKKKTSPVTLVRLCKNLEECDIDEVSKIIIEMGKKKEFPDITDTR